jgi:hypothetical protein
MSAGGAGRQFLGRPGSLCVCPVGDWSGRPPLVEWHRGGAGEPPTIQVCDLWASGLLGACGRVELPFALLPIMKWASGEWAC